MIKLITEKTKANQEGVSSFQAFCISTASRVGVGNLAGVVAAVSVGGPGAVFWMWVVALLSSGTAFIEATIALLYREKDPHGGYRGGAPYFIEKGLKMRWLGVIFVVFALICWAGVFQIISNSVTESFATAFNIDPRKTSLVLVALAAVVLFGRRDKIVKVLDKMVPFMSVIYLGVVIFIIVKNITVLPSMFTNIFNHAFGIKQFLGGTFGSVVMQGVKRGLFSNEAGSGSAPCAAAAAEIEHPVKQGLVQALGVFVDTILICSATAFVILLSDGKIPEGLQGMTLLQEHPVKQGLVQALGVFVDTILICSATAFVILLSDGKIPEGLQGMTLLQEAFRYQVGDWGVVFTAVILFLFSFSTMLGISFYAKPNLAFLHDKLWLQEAFKVFTLVMLYIGGIRPHFLVWNLADLGLALKTIVNLIGVYPLKSKAVESLKEN